MNNELQLLQIMAVFTGVAAVALLIQMVAMVGAMLTLRKLQTRIQTFLDRWEPIADTAQKTVEDVRRESGEILKQVREVAEKAKEQAVKADAVLDNLADTTKLQAQRIDETVQVLLGRVQETGFAVQQSVLAPVRQIRAVGIGIAAMIDALAGRRRASVDQATQDEEMFI